MMGVERPLRRRVGRNDGRVHVGDDRIVRRRGRDVPGGERRRRGGVGGHRRAGGLDVLRRADVLRRRQRRRAAALGHVDVGRSVVPVRQQGLCLGLWQRGTRVVPIGRRRVEARRRAGVGSVHVHAVRAAHDHQRGVGQVEPGDLEAVLVRDAGAGGGRLRARARRPVPAHHHASHGGLRRLGGRGGIAGAECERRAQGGDAEDGRRGAPLQDVGRGRTPGLLRRDDRRHHGRRQQDHQWSRVGIGVGPGENVAHEALPGDPQHEGEQRAGAEEPAGAPGHQRAEADDDGDGGQDPGGLGTGGREQVAEVGEEVGVPARRAAGHADNGALDRGRGSVVRQQEQHRGQ